jgi:hypothetical protein
MRWLLAFAVTVLAWGQELAPGQAAILDKARETALNYAKSLPDFLCTQVVRRSEDRQGLNRWATVDTLSFKVSYNGHEDYQLLLKNGLKTGGSLESVGGAISQGEFGTRLQDIFDPLSKSEFGWKGWGNLRKVRVAVFTYHVDQQHSRNRISYGNLTSKAQVVVGFHGEISVDPETGDVLRVTLAAEMPKRFPITACSSWTEYDHRDVAEREYLVPVESETRMEEDRYKAVNQIRYRDYRKFSSEATITFK